MDWNATGRQQTGGNQTFAGNTVIDGCACGSAVQTGLGIRRILLCLAVGRFESIPDMGGKFAIDQYQVGQQTTSVEIHRRVTQGRQLHQDAIMCRAMPRVGLPCQALHQCFFVPEACLGTFDKLVQGLDQTVRALFLQINPQNLYLSVDELVASLAYRFPGKAVGREGATAGIRG